MLFIFLTWLRENIKLHIWLTLLFFPTTPGALVQGYSFFPRTYSSIPSVLWLYSLFSFSPETTMGSGEEGRKKQWQVYPLASLGLAPAIHGWLWESSAWSSSLVSTYGLQPWGGEVPPRGLCSGCVSSTASLSQRGRCPLGFVHVVIHQDTFKLMNS